MSPGDERGRDAVRQRLAISPSEILERARDNARRRYVDGSAGFRAPRFTALVCAMYLAYGAAPFVPAVQSVTRVPAMASFALMAAMTAAALLAALVHARWGALDPRYAAISTLEAIFFVGGGLTLVGLGGTWASPYWVQVGVFVFAMATTVHRHATYTAIVAASVAGLAAWFAIAAHPGDALMALFVGATALIFQRFSTLTGWRAERLLAEAELTAERAGEALARTERQRIARELHDGVAAELTSALIRAQSLGADDGLTERVRASLAELRAVMQTTRQEALPARRLFVEIERSARLLVPATVTCDAASDLVDPERLVPGRVCAHVIRITQEAVHNASVHAHPGCVEVSLTVGDALELVVRDDGPGPGAVAIGDGAGGLSNIRSRARELGGEVTVRSRDGGGTELTVRVPLRGSADEPDRAKRVAAGG